MKKCRCFKCECFNRDNCGFCHILTDTSEYKNKCPFAKSGKTMYNELVISSKRIGLNFNEYKKILKNEVFDTSQYRNIFEVSKGE